MPKSAPPKVFHHMALILLAVALPVSAFDFLPDFLGKKDSAGTTVWESGRQFAKLVKRADDEGGKGGVNAHPVDLKPEQVRVVLEATKVRTTGGLFNDQTQDTPIFVDSEIATLSSVLARALEKAAPDEDVIFVIAGLHETAIAKEVMGTSGRVFYEDGKLNLLLGDVHKSMEGSQEQKQHNMAVGCGDCPVYEQFDPFKIPARNSTMKLDDPISVTEGLEFKNLNGKSRGDWLVFDVNKVVAAAERVKNKLPPALQKERERAQAEAAKANLERRQMREEMARMRKEMEQKRDGGDSAAGGQSVEDRLATLDKMKKKGLITDEEYATRRKQILNQI